MVAAAAMGIPGIARAETFAPVDQPGPALSVPAAELADALVCTPSVSTQATRPAVLMVPGTTLDPQTNFAWNYLRAFDRLGIPYCMLRSPNDAMTDIQVNGEHVVYAIREMHRRTGRRVQVVGFSQGGMVPRWALRFWPDVRPMVEDLVGLAPSNHGTTDADSICGAPDGCAPSVWQQRPGAAFLRALNSRQETFAGVDYTVAYTRTDQVVVPNQDAATGSSSVRTGDGVRTNVALQDICPTSTADHLATGSYDPVAFAIALDALNHPGPADPARIDRGVCAQPFQPGVDPATLAADYAAYDAKVTRVISTFPHVPAEPALACYTTASCPRKEGGTAERTGTPTTSAAPSCRSRRRFTIRLREPRGHDRLVSARVTVDGRAVRVRRRSRRLTARIDLRGRPAGRTVVRVRARTALGRTLRETRRYRRCARPTR